MNFQVEDAIKWFEKTNIKIQENKEYLTSLDRAIGDADHGINMARGFNEIIKRLHETEYVTVSDVMKDVAMTLITKVGGASGPLFGTAFLTLSKVYKDHKTIDYPLFIKGFEQAVSSVKLRGKANSGEKTLIDVWSPVVEQMNMDNDFHAENILETAKHAMEKTKDMKATKGRAAYLKERSIGHIDPGSVSSYYLFASLAEVIEVG